MLYFIKFRQILQGERSFNKHVIPLNHLSVFPCVCKTLEQCFVYNCILLSAVKKHLYCGQIKLIAFLISTLGVSELSAQLHNLPILYEKKQLVD